MTWSGLDRPGSRALTFRELTEFRRKTEIVSTL